MLNPIIQTAIFTGDVFPSERDPHAHLAVVRNDVGDIVGVRQYPTRGDAWNQLDGWAQTVPNRLVGDEAGRFMATDYRHLAAK